MMVPVFDSKNKQRLLGMVPAPAYGGTVQAGMRLRFAVMNYHQDVFMWRGETLDTLPAVSTVEFVVACRSRKGGWVAELVLETSASLSILRRIDGYRPQTDAQERYWAELSA